MEPPYYVIAYRFRSAELDEDAAEEFPAELAR
jgi:hypothetical protein